MQDGRPNPDELLAQVTKEEKESSQGKLKIFLGYSAGVGKTYTMLEEAQRQKEKGNDIVVACVESHGRKETEELLVGLESLPQKEIDYRGVRLKEMDLDKVLARRPQLALVDELAHTNAPGSRHSKRYQDVQEMLEAGIDVYTTLNIQHLESMNDAVAQVSGIKVRETIPDSVLAEANEIKIVDLPPNELIQRFKEGKVYVPDQASVAIENFFNEGNLIALREMTLRRAAEHVDDQMLEYMQTRSIPGPWPAGERLLVCVGNSQTLNERVVRTGRRLADEIKAEWFAMYVETPAHNRLSRQARQQALKGLESSAVLGAKTSTSFGISIADEVLRFARKNNITRIIVGHPSKARWQELLFGSVADQIVRMSGAIDVLVISDLKPVVEKRGEKEEKTKTPLSKNPYFYSIWLVLLISIFGFIVKSFLSPTNLVMFYLIGVVVAAILWGLWPAIFTSAMSVIAFDFFFIPPYISFRVSDSQYFITFLAFLFVGVSISLLVARMRDYASSAQRREEHTATLYALSVDLASANEIREVFDKVSVHVTRSCHCKSAYMIPEVGVLKLIMSSKDLNIDEKEMTAANWTYKKGTMAGKGTDTLSSSILRYYPLRTPNGVVGVMGIMPLEQEGIVKMEQERLLQAFSSQAAIAIERTQLWNLVCKRS
jgi:two-component system sensor histidine kinase KdpD